MNKNAALQNDTSRSNIKTIGKAAGVLKAISQGHSRLSDIAREVGLSKNGVYRLLYSLKQEELVIQDPVTREYLMGPLLFEISANPMKIHQHLINCAHLEIEDLRQTTGETVMLDVKFGMERIILRQMIGTHNVTFVGKPSPIDPLWRGAAGKVLLAQLEERELKTILDHTTLVASTPFTITDKKVFRREIDKVREQGYATGINDIEMGMADVAVPIEGYIVPASLAIIGPDDRLAPRIEEFVDRLKAKAGKISQYLATSLNK